MQKTSDAPIRAHELLPLVRSIGRELSERTELLDALEARMLDLAPDRGSSIEFQLVAKEAVTHYRAIRRAREELERIDCSVVGEHPLTVRIRETEGGRRHSLLWHSDRRQAGSSRGHGDLP